MLREYILIYGIKASRSIRRVSTSVRRFYEIDLSPFAGYAPVGFTVRRFSVRICPGLW